MQLLATSEYMQKLDNAAIEKFSIPGLVLMENAGRAFVEVLEKHAGSVVGRDVLIVCGKGNNGGDGFVIARHLANRGARVQVALLSKKREVKGDAKTNLDILLNIISSGRTTISFKEVSNVKRLSISPDGIIVDAIFGTGFAGAVKGMYKDVIDRLNAQSAFVASVDIPSGVDASTGIVENIAVRANLTVTMGLAKIGHYVGAGRDHAGTVEVVDIGIPRFLFTPSKRQTYRIRKQDINASLPRRATDAHKYSVGTVLVIAGSRNFTGAPVMTATSAMRAGAGAVILAVPKSIHQAVVRKVTEVMVMPLEETEVGTLSMKAIESIQEKLQWADVVAIGPGIGQHPETRELVCELLRIILKPLVLDADALGSLSQDMRAFTKRRYPTVITPHVGEFRVMSKLAGQEIERNRVQVTRDWAKRFNCTLVLKGAPTSTCTPDGNVFLNSTGNPGMATAGSGDVLTGIIASFLAQGMKDAEAAYSGTFVHGMAGDIATRKLGGRSVMAWDILDCIPHALGAIDVVD